MAVRWGLLSTASINDLILESCRDSRAAAFVAVASRELERAQAYAHARGIPRAWGSYEQLLADEEVDAVYVSVPNGLHVRWSLEALAAGKHVLCEKPLSRHPHEVEALYDAAERAGLVFGEAFMYRHHPQTQRVRELVASGELGELVLMRSAFSFQLSQAHWATRVPAEMDGGALMDLGCYQVGLCRLLAGEPLSVHGAQLSYATGTDRRFAATMQFRDGVSAQFHCAMDLPLRREFEIVGTGARLLLLDPWHCAGAPMQLWRDGTLEQIPAPSGDPYRLEFEAFARAVDGEHVPAFARDEAVAQAGVIGALYASAASQS